MVDMMTPAFEILFGDSKVPAKTMCVLVEADKPLSKTEIADRCDCHKSSLSEHLSADAPLVEWGLVSRVGREWELADTAAAEAFKNLYDELDDRRFEMLDERERAIDEVFLQ